MHVADSAGSASGMLASVEGMPSSPRWSPGGTVLRFSVSDPKTGAGSIREVSLSQEAVGRGCADRRSKEVCRARYLLEHKLQPKLDHPRVVNLRTHNAKLRRAIGRHRRAKLRRVEQVKEFGAELQRVPFAPAEI